MGTLAAGAQGADRRRPHGDAAFALPTLYEALKRRGMRYAIRLANDVLERVIEDLLTHPAADRATPRLIQYRSFSYQGLPGTGDERVIAKIEHHL